MTPVSLFRPVFLGVAGALLCTGGFLLIGCDGAGSKRDSFYERLDGSWTIERLEGGRSDYEARLDSLYPQTATITFRDDGQARTYEMTARSSDGSVTKLAEGFVELPSDKVLRMTGVFRQRPVTWKYGFEASRVRFRVYSGSHAFLNALIPAVGRDQSLKMTLSPEGN